jgi:peroxiredoxin
MRFFLLILLFAVAAGPVNAGRYNKVLNIGDQAPAWTDLPGVDDATHSLDDLKDKRAILIAFTCNSCPYANDAEDRVIALRKKYESRDVAVIAISVNKNPEDLLPAMKDHAKERKYTFPYLHDESQQIAKDYGAKYTPEFYVLDQQRRIAYMGALDDSLMGSNVKKPYVDLAIEAVLSGGKPEVTETAPVGCAVQYERIRRKRRKSTD